MRYRLLQIFHSKAQRPKLIYQPYWNPQPVTRQTEYHKRYVFLESDVLLRLFESGSHLAHEYFGVLSPNFAQKIDGAKMWGQLKNHGPAWDKEQFDRYCDKQYQAPIISFCRHMPHSVFNVAEKYHPGITKITKGILDKIGYEINLTQVNRQPIYFNYFLARKDVFDHFCKTLLMPFIMVAKDEPALWGNSGYGKPFPLKDTYNINHWPFHPFVAERLISLYIHKEKLNIAQP